MSDPLTPPMKPIRLWRRVMIGVVGLVVLIAVLGVIGNRYDHARTVGALQALTDQLDRDDPNWRLADLEANREGIPEDENSAGVIIRVSSRVPEYWIPPDRLERFLTPEVQLSPDAITSLEQALDVVAGILPEARRLVEMPRGRFRVLYPDNPLEAFPVESVNAHTACQILHLDTMLLAQKGDIDGALRSGRALINAARSVGDDPFLDTQQMRVGGVVSGCTSIERALTQGVASERELAAVQRLLEMEEKHPTLRIVARGVRAVHFDLYEKAISGKLAPAMIETLSTSRELSWWERLFGVRIRLRDQLASLRLTTRYVESTRLPDHEQAAALERLDIETSLLGKEPNRAVIHFDPERAGLVMCGKKALVRCMMVAVAVERFRLAHGKWPESLEQLTPKYLTEVPLDPHDGKPLVYERSTEGVTVFCQQKRHIDGDRQMAIGPTAPMGYRLWDVDKRRQPAKARPKEEIPP